MTEELASAEDAFRLLAPDLRRYARVVAGPTDADDVVNQAFADVLASNRWNRIVDHRAYLFRAVLNATRSMRRSVARREAREWRAVEVQPEAELLSDPAVREAVDDLSPQQRAMIYLTYWDDLGVAEVASMLDVSDGTVRRQLARARARLREVL